MLPERRLGGLGEFCQPIGSRPGQSRRQRRAHTRRCWAPGWLRFPEPRYPPPRSLGAAGPSGQCSPRAGPPPPFLAAVLRERRRPGRLRAAACGSRIPPLQCRASPRGSAGPAGPRCCRGCPRLRREGTRPRQKQEPPTSSSRAGTPGYALRQRKGTGAAWPPAGTLGERFGSRAWLLLRGKKLQPSERRRYVRVPRNGWQDGSVGRGGSPAGKDPSRGKDRPGLNPAACVKWVTHCSSREVFFEGKKKKI